MRVTDQTAFTGATTRAATPMQHRQPLPRSQEALKEGDRGHARLKHHEKARPERAFSTFQGSRSETPIPSPCAMRNRGFVSNAWRVVQTTVKTYDFVTSTGITAGFGAEATVARLPHRCRSRPSAVLPGRVLVRLHAVRRGGSVVLVAKDAAMWAQNEAGRVTTPLEPYVLGATLLLIPVLIIQADVKSGPWLSVANALNWAIWAVFLTEFVAILVCRQAEARGTSRTLARRLARDLHPAGVRRLPVRSALHSASALASSSEGNGDPEPRAQGRTIAYLVDNVPVCRPGHRLHRHNRRLRHKPPSTATTFRLSGMVCGGQL